MQAFETLFARVSTALKESVGHTLFTISYALPGDREVERIYTSLPAGRVPGGWPQASAPDRLELLAVVRNRVHVPWREIVINMLPPQVAQAA